MEKLRTINTTLALLMKGDKILLGEKKRGFAKGTLNGIGGKQDPGETIEQAMIRETQEEIGATPEKFEQVGRIDFDMYYKGEHAFMKMYIYKVTKFDGEIHETEEMIPTWFDCDKIPYEKMLEDDLLWFKDVLAGYKILGNVKFSPEMKMLSHKFSRVNSTEEIMDIK